MQGTAIINASLDEKVGSGSIDQRFRTVMACMRLCFRDVVGELGVASYTDPAGQAIQEHCAVVQISMADITAVALEDGLHHIAHSLGQDCVALMYPNGAGLCVGPRANRWPFDPRFFVMPAVCRIQQAA